MRIEIWSDIICPWCGLGSFRLNKALEAFPHRDQIELVRRSFVLQSDEPVGVSVPSSEYFARRGMPEQRMREMTQSIERIASSEGLTPYRVAGNRVGNTTLAHELAAWATAQGRSAEIWDALYQAYFGEQRSIFDIDSLVALTAEQGLDAEAAREALTSRRYQPAVLADIREAQALGSNGVPFIVLDRRLAVSGARPVPDLLRALEQAWAGRAPLPQAIDDGGEVCGPDGCEVPPPA